MSFLGPRPALFNQHDLIELRTQQGVHALVPGLTGWAQVNGRDELPIPDKVKLDVEYLHRQSLWFDIRILWLTFVKVLRRDGVSHLSLIHISEPTRQAEISYAVFCLKK